MISKLMYLAILAASSFSASAAQQLADSCSSTEFRCRKGGCISLNLICDGSEDCADGGDEIGCGKGLLNSSSTGSVLDELRRQVFECRKNEWTCWDGSCIPSRFQCDGVVDCEDESDENIDACRTSIYIRSLAVVAKLSGAYKENSLLEGTKFVENLIGVGVNKGTKFLLGKQSTCKLPEYPAFGIYNAINITNVKPGEEYESVTINVICLKGYGVDGPSQVKCQNGVWLAEIPNCVSQCYLPPHPSVEYRCLVSGPVIGSRNCSQFEPVGTLVSPRCQSPNYYSPTSSMYMRCNIHGKWDNAVKCLQVCGTVTADGAELIYGGRTAKKAEVPWHAGIYTKDKNPYMQICGGSLISINIVLSAAHCFWSGSVGKLPATNYVVAVGKLYRPWNDSNDKAQQSEVKAVHLPEHFQGSTSHFQTDIAVVITATSFKFNEFIRPVCVDFDDNFEKIQLQPGEMGKVPGWGLTSKNGEAAQVLQVIELPYVSTGKCIKDSPERFRPYISGDKICAGYNEVGKAVCKGDSGGGLTFPSTEKGTKRYYLRGIVSTAPTNDYDTCNAYAYTCFTQLQVHEHFIKEFWITEDDSSTEISPVEEPISIRPQESNCELPPYPDYGMYSTDIPDAKPGDVFYSVVINITCRQGYGVHGSRSVYCLEGSWSEQIPKCVPQCRLKQHPSVEYRCLVSGSVEGFRPCKEYEISGTVVSPQCRTPFYYSATTLSFMRCVDGSWDYVAKCIPDSGTLAPDQMHLIIGGQRTKHVKIPWHADIYRKTNIHYELQCGGSIISSSIVLSAGHCFWSDSLGQQLPASEYAVAVGKIYRAWNVTSNDEQRSEVKAIHLPTRYRGELTKFQDDIAVVIVKRHFINTLYIRPVSIDFNIRMERWHLQPGNKGMMAIWPEGLWNSSEVLKVLEIPYISVGTCFSESPPGFREYITSDKICAGFTNGSSLVCQENGGSGLAFPEIERGKLRYYIRGILSTAPISSDGKCSTDLLLTFTQILNHERFIKQFLEDTDADEDAESSQKGNCKLPDYPDHGTYITNIPHGAKPGDAFDSVTINVTCIEGYAVDGSNTISCYNGWWLEKLPKCVSQCHLKLNPSIEYRCLVSEDIDGYRPCNQYEMSGTVASPQCRGPNYYSVITLPFMRCINGNWDNIPRCSPECGTATPPGTQFRMGGQALKLPWHADIYSKTTDPYKRICGGSLVSESVVISAASCFWSTDGQEPATNFAITVGNGLPYILEDGKNGTQRSDVLEVHLPARFQGIATNYQDDIAVLIVLKPFGFTASIRPVCVDFDIGFERRHLRQGQIGMLTVWGFRITNENSIQALKVVDVPYVDVATCIIEAAAHQREFITSDKICGKFTDSTLCAGDGGSGLVFPESVNGITRYYLRGVLATGTYFENKCSERGATLLFTRVLTHQHFIKSVWSQ